METPTGSYTVYVYAWIASKGILEGSRNNDWHNDVFVYKLGRRVWITGCKFCSTREEAVEKGREMLKRRRVSLIAQVSKLDKKLEELDQG